MEIKKGDIFFASMKGISTWGIELNNSGAYGPDFMAADYVNQGFNQECPYILLAVKYIGNGVIEEMVTGEKMLLMLSSQYYDCKDVENKNCAAKYFCPLTYDTFVSENYGIGILNHCKILAEYKKISNEYPLTYLDEDENFYSINEITKYRYIEHSDEERRMLISTLKAKALEEIKDIHKTIDSEIQKSLTLTQENMDVAYLENQLYDFERKGKTI